MKSITVTTDTPVIYSSGGSSSQKPTTLPYPLSVVAVPGSGGTLVVAFQLVKDGTWVNWDSGAVNVTTASVLTGPVYALRFTAATVNGLVELSW